MSKPTYATTAEYDIARIVDNREAIHKDKAAEIAIAIAIERLTDQVAKLNTLLENELYNINANLFQIGGRS